MRFHQTIDENGKALRRIAALLFALADLVERAAGRSRAVCLLVLWLLRPGEAIARDYVDSLVPGAARLPLPSPLRPDTCATAALRLAQSFRSLAAALASFADDCRVSWRARHARRLFAVLVAMSALAAYSADPAPVGRLDSS